MATYRVEEPSDKNGTDYCSIVDEYTYTINSNGPFYPHPSVGLYNGSL